MPPQHPPQNGPPWRLTAPWGSSGRSPAHSPHEQYNPAGKPTFRARNSDVRNAGNQYRSTTALAVVIVTGLSGGGKASILRALEDVGYEAVDNPPLTMLEEMVARGDRKLAIGIDARTRGFDAASVLLALARLRANPALLVELVYAWADQTTLLRRYTETRRRHPLAPQGVVSKGIAAEQRLDRTDLREHADLVVDTSGLPIANLRRLIEQHFGAGADRPGWWSR